MYRPFVLLLALLFPCVTHGQGVLEKMQEDIVAAVRAAADNAAEIVKLKDRIANLEKLVLPPEPPLPPPPPQPDPEPPLTGEIQLKLLGGWRVPGEFSRGGMAIDHVGRKLYMVGHAQRNEVYEYTLTDYGTQIDFNTWPKLKRDRLIAGWWEGGYANGLAIHGGKLWSAPRKFYDMAPPSTTTLYAAPDADGKVATMTIHVPRQVYSGFVKGGTAFPLIGGGGYESGQGSALGTSLSQITEKKDDGTFNAKVLIPRSFESSWSNRERREPDYWPIGGVDGWTALVPKDADGDGKIDGCWACDRIFAGGIKHSTGIYYWPWMATAGPDGKPGIIDYKLQNETFCVTNKTCLYRYDPATFKLMSYKPFPVDNRVLGQDISPDGKFLYLIVGNQWASGLYKVDHVLQIYEIK